MKFLFTIFLLGIFVTPAYTLAESPAQKGYRIAKMVDKFNSKFKGEKSRSTLTIIDAKGNKIRRSMKSITKEVPKDGDKSLIEFTSPADIKGTRLLSWAHKDKDDDQWLYMPALKRVKRIASSGQNASFMGSEFTYEDIVAKDLDKFTYKFLKTEKINNRPTWVIERHSKEISTGYSKVIVWIDQGYKSGVKIEYYDRSGSLLKVSTFKKFKKYKKWWRPRKIFMVNKQTRKKSIIEWKHLKLGVKLSDSRFSKSSLEDNF